MRLFIALDLPEPVRAALAGAQARLFGHPVRWADVAGLHLTLQFLGEVEASLVEPLLGALVPFTDARVDLALAGLGAFPNLRQPRVVWVGVGGDRAGLAELQAAVVAATAPLGFTPEARPFTPHLTLGRVRQGARPKELQALGEAFARLAPPTPLAWEAGPPLLFQSTLTPAGAVYRRLGPAGASPSAES
jgi:2'-5' RNA ligase